MTNFHRQKCLNQLDTLNQLVDAKNASLTAKTFSFKGDPLVSTSTRQKASIAHFELVPYKRNVVRQKVQAQGVSHFFVEQFIECLIVDDSSSSVSLKLGSKSVVKIDIDGTVSASKLHECILVLRCHQVRLHDMTNCLVVTEVDTNIIIENCHGLKFAGGAKVDDFNFNFGASDNYSLVDFDGDMGWIGEDFDGERLEEELRKYVG